MWKELGVPENKWLSKHCHINLATLENMKVKPTIVIQEPGDIIITASQALHQVINIEENTAGLSSNLLVSVPNSSNIEKILQPDKMYPGLALEASDFQNVCFYEDKIKAEHLANVMKCKNCGKAFKAETKLESHGFDVHGSEYLGTDCLFCGKSFQKFKSRKTHETRYHKGDSFKPTVKITCLSCDEEIKERSKLEHYKASCKNKGACPFCLEAKDKEDEEIKNLWDIYEFKYLEKNHKVECYVESKHQSDIQCPVRKCQKMGVKMKMHLKLCLQKNGYIQPIGEKGRYKTGKKKYKFRCMVCASANPCELTASSTANHFLRKRHDDIIDTKILQDYQRKWKVILDKIDEEHDKLNFGGAKSNLTGYSLHHQNLRSIGRETNKTSVPEAAKA